MDRLDDPVRIAHPTLRDWAVQAAWLGQDPEHGPVLRLTFVEPWQERPGIWSEQTPEWVRTLGAIATTAHEKRDPFGRRPGG